MSRVQFEVQGREVYTSSMRVRVSDINYGGHLGNDSVLTLCQEARVRFFESMGYSEINLYGRGIIMSDAMVMYRSEGRLGDSIEIRVCIDDVGKFGFDMYYELSVPEEDGDGPRQGKKGKSREIARVKTGIVFFDYEKRRVAKCPKEFVEKFSVEK
ncbi:MAG: thioesterase family protein [Spirochaetaceae bacterium]